MSTGHNTDFYVVPVDASYINGVSGTYYTAPSANITLFAPTSATTGRRNHVQVELIFPEYLGANVKHKSFFTLMVSGDGYTRMLAGASIGSNINAVFQQKPAFRWTGTITPNEQILIGTIKPTTFYNNNTSVTTGLTGLWYIIVS